MNPDDLGVDSIHINIGQGDCAIHLLIQHPTDTRPTIIRATLIDGGPRTLFVSASIINAIAKIKNKYNFPVCTNDLKFDSVVVTHWDTDHFQGVVDLMENDITNQLRNIPDPTDISEVRCSYFKYGGDGRKDPLTTFYAPYWNAKPEWRIGDHVPPALKENTKGLMDFVIWREKPEEVAEITGKRKGRGKKGKKGEEKDIEALCFNGLCRLSYEPGDMLGVNFFTNEKLGGGIKYGDITSPEVLVKNTQWDFPVGIYCICSRGAVLGSKDPPFDVPVKVKVVDEPNEVKNHHSVGAVVLWGYKGHISHYFAGDAMYKTEEKITKWICREVPKRVTSMKFSHHGAASSTPIKMIKELIPINMIASAGKQHRHPRM